MPCYGFVAFIKISFAEHCLVPAWAYRVDTIDYNILLSLYAAGHGTLERQSTQSALSIQQWAFLRKSKHIKKTAALCFVSGGG